MAEFIVDNNSFTLIIIYFSNKIEISFNYELKQIDFKMIKTIDTNLIGVPRSYRSLSFCRLWN